jgi:hypothetical protein
MTFPEATITLFLPYSNLLSYGAPSSTMYGVSYVAQGLAILVCHCGRSRRSLCRRHPIVSLQQIADLCTTSVGSDARSNLFNILCGTRTPSTAPRSFQLSVRAKASKRPGQIFQVVSHSHRPTARSTVNNTSLFVVIEI